jgi:hypothetical protein
MSKAKYDRLEVDRTLIASGTNTISGTTAISGTVTDSSTKTVSGSQTFSGDNTFTGNQTLSGAGTARPIGWNRVSTRYELKWVAGAHGLPALNAVIATDENSNAAAHLARNLADREFEILGTNASTDDVTRYAEGGITLTTDGGGTDSIIVLPHLDSAQSAWSAVTWGTDKSTEWECDFSTSADITACVIWAGLKLTNTSTTATDAKQVFFRFAPATNSGKWQAIYSINGTDTEGDSGVTVAASTRYHLKILISATRIATMYINGTLVATSTALDNTTDLIPYIGVLESEAVGKVLHIHGQAISRVIG